MTVESAWMSAFAGMTASDANAIRLQAVIFRDKP